MFGENTLLSDFLNLTLRQFEENTKEIWWPYLLLAVLSFSSGGDDDDSDRGTLAKGISDFLGVAWVTRPPEVTDDSPPAVMAD